MKLLLTAFFCISLVSGNTCLSSSGSISGNLSSAATWTACGGGVPGDGDTTVWNSTGTLTIDQNWGTVGGGGIKTVRVEAGTIQLDTSAARTIIFASTGVDPLGSGITTNPGDDATMQGFFMAKGTLDLRATSAATLTITTPDGTSPVYIQQLYFDFLGCTTFTAHICNGAPGPGNTSVSVLLDYVHITSLGYHLSSYAFDGISMQSNTGSSSLSVIHTEVDACYRLALVANGAISGAIAITDNLIQNSSAETIWITAGNATSWDISRNTDISPSNTSTFFFTYPAYSTVPFTFNGNAILGPRPALDSPNSDASSTFSDNYCSTAVSNGSSCVELSTGGSKMPIVGNTVEGLHGSFYINGTTGTPVTLQNNWSSIPVNNGQGTYTTPALETSIHNNVVVQLGSYSNTAGAFFAYSAGGDHSVISTVDHNTFWSVSAGTGTSGVSAVLNGDSGGTSADAINTPSKFRSNIFVCPGGGFCWLDYNDYNTYGVDTPPGVGVHHNMTAGTATPFSYYPTVSHRTGMDNGTVWHPSAIYNDIDGIDPRLAEPTRTPATFDARVLGGPGTVAHLFAELGKRSGWGGACNVCGTYTDGGYRASSLTVLQALNRFLREGATPQALQVRNAGHDGADLGAMPTLPSQLYAAWVF
jgi:hypothetical protein